MSLNDIRKKNGRKSSLIIKTTNGEYPEELIKQNKNIYENLVKPVRDKMIETMIKNERVYCTNCKHLKLEEIHKGKGDYIVSCPHEKECEIYDVDDSRPLSERPYYEEV